MINVVSEKSASPAGGLEAVKARQRAMWASGDYTVIGTTLQIVGEQLNEAADVCAGERVLDVAAGNGNATLAAARRFAEVTSTDYVPALLERGRRRAEAEGLDVTFEVADVEALPYADASYDVVLSTFGVMFAPNQAQAARELLRTCRPGGRVGLANWTPDGWIGEVFRVTGRHVPPPAGLWPPTRWGTEEGLRELFGDGAAALRMTRQSFVWRFASAHQYLDVFRTYYGPTLRAFAALDEAGQAALARDLIELVERFNRSDDGTLLVPSEYLEVVAVKEW